LVIGYFKYATTGHQTSICLMAIGQIRKMRTTFPGSDQIINKDAMFWQQFFIFVTYESAQ
jgi:hypothetical protein